MNKKGSNLKTPMKSRSLNHKKVGKFYGDVKSGEKFMIHDGFHQRYQKKIDLSTHSTEQNIN